MKKKTSLKNMLLLTGMSGVGLLSLYAAIPESKPAPIKKPVKVNPLPPASVKKEETKKPDQIEEVSAESLGFSIIGSISEKKKNGVSVALIKYQSNNIITAVKEGSAILDDKYVIAGITKKYILLQDNGPNKMHFVKAHMYKFTIGKKSDEKKEMKSIGIVDKYQEPGFSRDNNKIVLDQNYRANIVKDLPSILMQASAEPVYGPQGIQGFSLDLIEPGSIYEKAGLANGDVVKSINGTPLDNINATIKLLQSLKNADEVSFEVSRGGSPLNLAVNVQ